VDIGRYNEERKGHLARLVRRRNFAADTVRRRTTLVLRYCITHMWSLAALDIEHEG
jgi:hypothetical protein